MIILGADLSPTSSGLVKFILDENLEIVDIKKLGFCAYEVPKKKAFTVPNYKDIISYDKSKYDFYNRTIMMTEHIFEFIKDVDYAAIEDYAYAGNGDITGLAEFCSQVKFQLLRQGTKLRLVEPPTLKKYATDDGHAKKPEMFDSFVEYSGEKIDISDLPEIPVHKSGKFVGLRNFSGISPLSDSVDSFFLVLFLHEELQIRKGTKQLSDLIPHHSHILSRITKANKTPIIKQEFIQKNV